jgi:tRNA modification GTPase
VHAREVIVAVASPPGRGARGLVRASGRGLRAAARIALGVAPEARGVFFARVRLADGLGACPVVAMWMEEGASFTGEESLEVSCVGSPALLEAVAAALIDAARAGGTEARWARPGEFAFRAHLAGRLSVDGAEAIAARIAATNDAEIAAADALARGATGARAAELVVGVAELLALVEAGIDFTDQDDVVAIAPRALAARAEELARGCDGVRGAQASARAQAVPLVVLAGAPNAGKSTLFNALLGRARTVASAYAGTTRDAIVERLALGAGLEIDLADIAGIEDRPACGMSAGDRDSIEARMQRGARDLLGHADIVVRCTPEGDATVALPGVIEGVGGVVGDGAVDRTGGDLVDVSTKCDMGGDEGGAEGTLRVSAVTGAGLPALRTEIASRIRRDRALRQARLATILPRHDAAFAAASAALRETVERAQACSAAGRLADVELVASLLRAALDALGDVAGPMHPDDVLGLVFSRFCIGK